MAHTSRAWVMEVGAGVQVAAGAPHVVEYILATETIDVPRVPGHCVGLLLWRDRMIPAIDLAPALTEDGAMAARTNSRRAVILAYQEAPGQPLGYGALLITAAPAEAWVSDDMAGPLPETPAAWRHIARACFMRQDKAIPILDPKQLFARPLPGAPAPATGDGVNADDLSRIESALARHLEPANEAPRAASIAQDVQLWRIVRTETDLQAAPPEPAGHAVEVVAGDDTAAQMQSVVIPFASFKAADSAVSSPESESPVEARAVTPDPTSESLQEAEPDGVPPAAIAAMDAPEPDGPWHGETHAAMVENATSGPEVLPKPSNTLQSFERLRALERTAGRPPDRHRLRWALLAAGLALAALTIALLVPMEKASPARDVAPGGIKPSSIPSAPAQPPK